MTAAGGLNPHSQAEESTPRTAVMLDHVWAMDITEHHEGHPTGRPHRLPFYGSIGTSSQLTKRAEDDHRCAKMEMLPNLHK